MIAALLLVATSPMLPPQLAPLAFVSGHCWRAAFSADTNDTHCFRVEGDTVRDHHEVVTAGRTVYSGDTIYRWDGVVVRYEYTSTDGRMEGEMHSTADGLDFGTATFVHTNGAREAVSAHWKRVGDEAYEVTDNNALSKGLPRRYHRVD